MRLLDSGRRNDEELAERRAWAERDVAWHARSAAAAESAREWFPATFHLTALLTVQPANGRLWLRRTQALVGLQRWPEALLDFVEAVALYNKTQP